MKFCAWVCGLAVLSQLTSLAETAPAWYPIGIYAVNSTNDFAMIREAGFNAISGIADKTFLDSAQAAGLKVLARPGTSAGREFNPSAAEAAVKAFDTHPALWAWYLVDEPDLNLIAPAEVVRGQRALKRFGAQKPTAVVLCQGYAALDYANIADITMIDRYPVPWLPLANFGQHVEMVRLALGKAKPLVAIIQAFDWNSCPELLPGQKDLRPPTYDEMRCMTYEALARGANGLFYFAFDAGWKMREHPETWAALKRVIEEVNRYLPLFQATSQWWAKDHAFADTSNQFNAALESSISSSLVTINKGNALLPAGNYIVAVNNTEKTHLYSFALPPTRVTPAREAASTPLTVLGESRSLRSEQNRVEDEFKPYAVHVYGPLE